MAEERDPSTPGRTIPDPGFADDDGSADPALAAALGRFRSDPPAHHLEVFLALQHARLLVPVVAVPSDVEVDGAGRTRERSTDMATVLLTGRDGRQALLGFSSMESLTAWRADARPVPVAAPLVARSAVDGGAAALVVDVAGPTTYVVEGDLLEGLAAGWALADTGQGLAFMEPIEDDEETQE